MKVSLNTYCKFVKKCENFENDKHKIIYGIDIKKKNFKNIDIDKNNYKKILLSFWKQYNCYSIPVPFDILWFNTKLRFGSEYSDIILSNTLSKFQFQWSGNDLFPLSQIHQILGQHNPLMFCNLFSSERLKIINYLKNFENEDYINFLIKINDTIFEIFS